MPRFVRIAVYATCGLLQLFATLPSMSESANSPLAIEIREIKEEPSADARTEDARRLADQVRRHELVASDADIELLAEMLSDRDDSVRYWIAMTLGYIGPRAQEAVPALRKALQEIQCVHGDKTSASALRMALAKVGAAQLHQDCS
jgi:HEAT repeat protein